MWSKNFKFFEIKVNEANFQSLLNKSFPLKQIQNYALRYKFHFGHLGLSSLRGKSLFFLVMTTAS